MDFLWHRVSKEEQKAIKKEAKSILNAFSKKVSTVKSTSNVLEQIPQERKEKKGNQCDQIFRKRILENAPNKTKQTIKAEKGAWKQ